MSRTGRLELFGAISRWRIELPKEQNYFDMHSISDVILHLSYTAKEGGDLLCQKAIENARHYLPGNSLRLFDVKNDKSEDWYQFEGNRELSLHFGRNDFSYLPYKHEMRICRIDVFIELNDCYACDQLEVFYKELHDCKDCDDFLISSAKRSD